MAVAAGASVLIVMASLSIVPLAASAAGTTPTTTTVTAKPASTLTGRPLTITAKVAVTGTADTVKAMRRFAVPKAATGNSGVPTGTVTFTITGSDSSTLSCKNGNTVPISHSGKAICHIPVEVLQAVASPYTIQGVYSGDANFAGSTSAPASEAVAKARTHIKVTVKPTPRNGTANTFTAKITSGKAGSLLSGDILFSVASAPGPSNKGKLKCTGGDLQPIAVTGNVGTATCSLVAGWFDVPPRTHMTPHPKGTYDVSASFAGNGDFLQSAGTKQGHSKF